MGKAEHLPPQSNHQVMPDVSAWVEDVLPEGHMLRGGCWKGREKEKDEREEGERNTVVLILWIATPFGVE